MCDEKRVAPSQPAHSCACGGHAGSAGRVVDAATELVLPAVQFPSSRVLKTAGEAKLRDTVWKHHARLAESSIGRMFPADPAVFATLVDKVADFVVEACGGPANYSPANGNTCMRTRHFPFTIDETSREVWLEALYQAMEDVDFPVDVREEYWNWLEAFSVRMINRRTMKAQPVRIPYLVARLRFAPGVDAGMPCGTALNVCPRG